MYVSNLIYIYRVFRWINFPRLKYDVSKSNLLSALANQHRERETSRFLLFHARCEWFCLNTCSATLYARLIFHEIWKYNKIPKNDSIFVHILFKNTIIICVCECVCADLHRHLNAIQIFNTTKKRNNISFSTQTPNILVTVSFISQWLLNCANWFAYLLTGKC